MVKEKWWHLTHLPIFRKNGDMFRKNGDMLLITRKMASCLSLIYFCFSI